MRRSQTVSCEATVVTEAPAEDDEATTLKKKQHSQYVQMYKKFCANKEQISADHPHIISWFFKSSISWFDSCGDKKVQKDIISNIFSKCVCGKSWVIDASKPFFKEAKVRCVMMLSLIHI